LARDMFYTAIDLGTTKICTLIAKIGEEGDLKVLGTGIVPSQGIQKGMVESIPEAQDAIRASLTEAQRYLGRGVSWAYVGITGDHIKSLNTTGTLTGERIGGPISSQDVSHLIQASYPSEIRGKEILHIVPISYTVDGLTGVRNPVGLHAKKVEVESHVAIADAAALKNVIKSVEGCKVSVRNMAHQPMASAEAVLTEDEREVGCVLVDIGGGTTDMIVFRMGSPWYASVIPVGGNQVTRDLSVALGVPFYTAEEIKLKWGNINIDSISNDEEVQIPGFQGEAPRMVNRKSMCLPLQERISETLKLVLLKLQDAGLRQFPQGGLVLTGGGAEIEGLKEFAEKLTGMNARIAYPRGILGLPSQLKKPAYSTSVGTLLWGIKHHGEGRVFSTGEKTLWGYKAFLRRFARSPEKVAV